MTNIRPFIATVWQFLRRHPHHVVAGSLLFVWCVPYFVSGNSVEWGDFSFFAQGAEAIRSSILTYHQFPWLNPWVAGGVPLYANPQFGVFSLQTLLGLLFGAVAGLKITAAIFTVGGYASMFLLARKYFKLSAKIATVISLLWVFNSFFVNHVPSHFTFIWYFLAPLFVYIALTIKDWRGGLLLGGLFAAMGLAEIHYSFFHIAIICAGILAVRLVRGRIPRKALVFGLLAAAGLFIIIVGHRALFTIENVREFPRIIMDGAANPIKAVMAVTLPFFAAHKPPYQYPSGPFGWGEMSASFGALANIALFLLVGLLVRRLRQKPKNIQKKELLYASGLLGLALTAFAIGLGGITKFSPYSLLKLLPILSDMRVSTRWFIWYELSALLFMGFLLMRSKPSLVRTLAKTFLTLGVLELFALGVGYQFALFGHQAVTAPKPESAYQFIQGTMFGDTRKLPTGDVIPDDGHMPGINREYEATTFNIGTLRANDALVDLRDAPTLARCAYNQGCGFVLSGNAKLVSWSPNKIVLERTGQGDIKLDLNNSDYFVVNGVRNSSVRTAEPLQDFTITTPATTITIEAKPSLGVALKHLLSATPKQ